MSQGRGLIPATILGAAAELRRHPGRTLLICQGILWAVVLMVAPASILEGSRGAALERSKDLGTDRIQVEVQPGSRLPLEIDDLEALLTELQPAHAEALVSGLSVSRRLTGENGIEGYLVSTDEEELAARSLHLLQGRWLEGSERGDEVVIEQPLADSLLAGKGSELIGETLWVSRPGTTIRRFGIGDEIPPGASQWRVVGILRSPAEAGVDPLGFGKDHRFSDIVEAALKMLGVAPTSAPWMQQGHSMHVLRDRDQIEALDWIVVTVDPLQINEAKEEVEKILIRRGKVPLVYANAAWSILASPELDGYLVLHDIFFYVTVTIGLLVLINLLLLTGRRRRPEVGLRRAEGATRADIFWQFLWEGILIALVGGILGALTGVMIAELRANLDPAAILTASWPWQTIIESLLLVTGGSAIACAGPAWLVSDVDPASLLRDRR